MLKTFLPVKNITITKQTLLQVNNLQLKLLLIFVTFYTFSSLHNELERIYHLFLKSNMQLRANHFVSAINHTAPSNSTYCASCVY